MNSAQPISICYFGIYKSDFSRNKIYISGLRKIGVNVIECRDDSRGIIKFWRLWRKHRALEGQYSALIVGYPGHVVTPLARLISRKKVILDALGTLYEAEVMSHGAGLMAGIRAKCIDWLAVKSAHVVLVESEPQKRYFLDTFGGSPDKYQVVYTGADEESLEGADDESAEKGEVKKPEGFKVLFRGSLTPEAGLEYILNAAAILEKNYSSEGITFRILGRGIYEKEVRALLAELNLQHVEFDTERLPWPELVARMKECSVSLGQFSVNPRLQRTIPHKAFESLALGLPYITARAEGAGSLLTDGLNCLMVTPADAADLAEKILELKRNESLASRISENGHRLFKEKLTPVVLAREIMSLI